MCVCCLVLEKFAVASMQMQLGQYVQASTIVLCIGAIQLTDVYHCEDKVYTHVCLCVGL